MAAVGAGEADPGRRSWSSARSDATASASSSSGIVSTARTSGPAPRGQRGARGGSRAAQPRFGRSGRGTRSRRRASPHRAPPTPPRTAGRRRPRRARRPRARSASSTDRRSSPAALVARSRVPRSPRTSPGSWRWWHARAGAVVGEVRIDDRAGSSASSRADQRRRRGPRPAPRAAWRARRRAAGRPPASASRKRWNPCEDRATVGTTPARPDTLRGPRRSGEIVRYRRMPIEEESPEQLGYGRSATTWPRARCRTRRWPTSAWTWAGSCSSTATTWAARAARGDRGGRAGRGGRRRDRDPRRGRRPVRRPHLAAGARRPPLVARPNYATNVETPRAIGADVTYLDLAFEDGWAVDPERVAALMTPRTKLVSLTTPTTRPGDADEATLDAVIGLVEARRRAPAPRRDVPRDDVRRAAPGGGVAEPAG